MGGGQMRHDPRASFCCPRMILHYIQSSNRNADNEMHSFPFCLVSMSNFSQFKIGCNGKPVYRNSPVFFKYRNNRCLKREIPNIPKFSVKEKYRKIPKNTDYHTKYIASFGIFQLPRNTGCHSRCFSASEVSKHPKQMTEMERKTLI